MYKKFTQNVFDEVKERILNGDFDYFDATGSDLDDDDYDDIDDDDFDSDEYTDIDDIDIDDYSKVEKFYKRFYLVETEDKMYNILDSENMVVIFDEDVPYIKRLNHRGLILIGNIYIDHDLVWDFKVKRPNRMFDLDTLEYPMDLDWFVVGRLSDRVILMSNSEKFILFDTFQKSQITREYDTIQKVMNDVYISSTKVDDNYESYDFIDMDNDCLINLTANYSLKNLKGVQVSSEYQFIIEDNDGNSYQIKLDENKNYIINKL